MFYFKTFKNPVFLLSLFAVFALLSLFSDTNPAMAAGIFNSCQGPLTQYDKNYGDSQFDCNTSSTQQNNYYCEETAGQLAYCRSFANPSSDYYDCGVSTVNIIVTSTGFLFVNCSLANTFSVTLTPMSTSRIDVSWPAISYVGGIQVGQVRIERYQCSLINGNCWDDFIITVPSSPALYSNIGLSPNTTYYFWIAPLDSAGNALASAPRTDATTLSDSTPPSNITNLSVSSCSSASCSLSWTAPGNDGNVGTASSYDMRYSTSPINDSNWTSATQATGEPTPTISGSAQSMIVSGLNPTTTYYFAIKSSDGANISALSNVPVTGTTTAVPDTTAPTVPSGLTATAVSSSQINLSWSASTDVVGVAGYRIERCQGAGCLNFSFLTNVTSGVVYNDDNSGSGLPSSTSFSYRIRAYDAVPNSSNYSNIASDITDPPPDTLSPIFTKTAPAVSSLASGTLSTNLSGSTNEIAICRWADSTGQPFISMNPMNPVSGGMNHTATITNLVDGKSYYVKCRDTAPTPNISGDFFVFSVDSPIPDTTPPQISDRQPSGTLAYFPSGSGTVTISVVTNKPAYCRYSQNTDADFNLMTALNTAPSTDARYQRYHFTDQTVFNGANYEYYVRCQDTTTSITNTSGSPPISFSFGTAPNILPTVNLTASPTSGDAPLTVSVSGTANDPDSDLPLIYSLNWGDGFSESYDTPSSPVSHTYNNAGSYTVTLTVWDARMNANASGVSDMEYITVNALQESILPPITGGICAVECNENTECVSVYGTGFVCGPSHICISEAAADVGPDRSGEYASLTDGTVFVNFPAGTQTVMINLSTDTNAECRFAVNQSTNNGEAGVAYDFNGAGIIMNQFSTSDYKNHSATINIGAAKSCSPGTPNSCGYDKQDDCPSSGKCNSYGFSAVCRNTFGTLEPNTTDHPILFSIGAPELLACIPGEMCPSGLPCPSSGPLTGRCEPAPYTCLINQYFIKNNIPYLLDICFPGFTPAPSYNNYVPPPSCGASGQQCCATGAQCTGSLTCQSNNTCGGSACTPSCGACSVSCGGGTQTCTSTNCSTYTQTCNPQACVVPAPAPTLSISASPASVSYDSFSIVTWSTTNATTCTASGAWSGNKAISGSETMLNLQSNKTYTLQCSGSGGDITKSATVTVASLWVQKGNLGLNLRDLQSWNGRLYAAGDSGVSYWSGSSWVNATTTQANAIEIWNGELCVGFWGKGVRCYNGSNWTSTLRPDGLISDLELWESSSGNRLCAEVWTSSNGIITCYDGVSWTDIQSSFTIRGLENWVIGASKKLCYSGSSSILCNDGSGFSNFTNTSFNELIVWNNMLCGISSSVNCYSSAGTLNQLSNSYGQQGAATVWGSRLCVDKSNTEISCYDSTWTDYGTIPGANGGSITDVEVWNSTICVSFSTGEVRCYEP